MINNMNPMQIMNMAMQLKNNPMAILGQFGVPQNIANNPNEVMQFLMKNNKLSQNQYNQAVQIAKNMGIKL